MSEETRPPEPNSQGEVDVFPSVQETGDLVSPPPAAAGGGRRSFLRWLFVALIAVVPAVVVGLIVFSLAGGDEERRQLASLDGFVRRFTSGGDDFSSYTSLDAPGFPADFPRYEGSTPVAVFAIRSEQGTTFIVSIESEDSVIDVYAFYLVELDSGPWQVEAAVSGVDFTGVQFSRPDSADVQGDITISKSELDGRTSITLFYSDISQQVTDRPVEDFVLPLTRALPPDFPEDIPIYAGESESIVTEAFFRRDAGQISYFISFLTQDADLDVIDFYREEFESRGWLVTDAAAQPGVFSLAIDFQDRETEDISGNISADFFPDDPDYTLVELLVQVSPTRGR